MATQKKLYFYKVSIKTKGATSCEIPKRDILALFHTINGYNEEGKPFTYQLQFEKDNTMVEILQVTSNSIFGRIGKKEDINYLHFRFLEKHKSENINVPSGSYPEKFTYFYFNYDTNILAYLNILSAPIFRKFEKFLIQLCNEQYHITVLPVSNMNVLDSLKRKDIISGFTIKTTIPTDDFLGCDNLSLTESDFKQLENADSITISINVNGKRKKNISFFSGEKNPMFKIIEKIKQKSKDCDIKVKASNKDEHTMLYDIVEQEYTYKIDIPDIKDDAVYINEIKASIIQAYNTNIEEIKLLAKCEVRKNDEIFA